MEVLPAQEYETPSAPPIPFYDHPSLNEQREWEAWRVAERQEYFSHPSMPPFQEVGRTSSFAYEQQTPSNMISQAPQGDLHNGWEGPEAHQGLHGWAAAHPASAAIWADAPPSVKQGPDVTMGRLHKSPKTKEKSNTTEAKDRPLPPTHQEQEGQLQLSGIMNWILPEHTLRRSVATTAYSVTIFTWGATSRVMAPVTLWVLRYTATKMLERTFGKNIAKHIMSFLQPSNQHRRKSPRHHHHHHLDQGTPHAPQTGPSSQDHGGRGRSSSCGALSGAERGEGARGGAPQGHPSVGPDGGSSQGNSRSAKPSSIPWYQRAGLYQDVSPAGPVDDAAAFDRGAGGGSLGEGEMASRPQPISSNVADGVHSRGMHMSPSAGVVGALSHAITALPLEFSWRSGNKQPHRQ